MVILRESTEGLFYSAAVHGRAEVIGDTEVRDTLRITRETTEKLMHFGFRLAEWRKARGRPGRLDRRRAIRPSADVHRELPAIRAE